MLALSQSEPFKYTISNLKSVVQSQQIDKQQLQIKSTLKTLNEITNLNQSLKLLIDSTAYEKINKIAVRLMKVFVTEKVNSRVLESCQNMPTSPARSIEKNKSLVLKHTKYIDLTPSTKKSRVFSTHTIPHLIEDLIDSLQKFDELKQNSQRIKYLIQQLYDGLQQFTTEDGDSQQQTQEMNIQLLWREINGMKMEDVQQKVNGLMETDKMHVFFQLLEHVENVHKSVENIKSTTVDIYNFFQPGSIDEQDNQSRDSYQLEAVTKKSNNPSQQRSLLTEMLKDSSQKSNLQLPSQTQNQYSSQIILRPRLRLREYSQNENDAHLDSHFKFSYKSAKFNPKSYNKEIQSEMSYYEGGNDQNMFECQKIVKRKEVKIKRSEMSCSRCEIF